VIVSQPASTRAVNGLRVKLSSAVTRESVEMLRTEGLSASLAMEVSEVIRRAGGKELKPVYQLKPEELDNDEYGFAREFTVWLSEESNPAQSLELLRSSPWFDEVRPIRSARTW